MKVCSTQPQLFTCMRWKRFHWTLVLLRCQIKLIQGSDPDDALIECAVFGPVVIESVMNGSHCVTGILIVRNLIRCIMTFENENEAVSEVCQFFGVWMQLVIVFTNAVVSYRVKNCCSSRKYYGDICRTWLHHLSTDHGILNKSRSWSSYLLSSTGVSKKGSGLFLTTHAGYVLSEVKWKSSRPCSECQQVLASLHHESHT